MSITCGSARSTLTRLRRCAPTGCSPPPGAAAWVLAHGPLRLGARSPPPVPTIPAACAPSTCISVPDRARLSHRCSPISPAAGGPRTERERSARGSPRRVEAHCDHPRRRARQPHRRGRGRMTPAASSPCSPPNSAGGASKTRCARRRPSRPVPTDTGRARDRCAATSSYGANGSPPPSATPPPTGSVAPTSRTPSEDMAGAGMSSSVDPPSRRQPSPPLRPGMRQRGDLNHNPATGAQLPDGTQRGPARRRT